MPPQAPPDKVVAAASFNQSFMTSESLGAAMLDQAWHQGRAEPAPADVITSERWGLANPGICAAVPPRCRITCFSHIMAG